MIPKRSPRFLALLIAGTLVGALFASPALAAKPPKPGGTAVAQPGTVAPTTGLETNYVAFDVTFTNRTNTSLQQVTMTAATPTNPLSDLEEVSVDPFLVDPSGNPVGALGSCDASGTDLSCTIGTIPSLHSVKLSVVYEVPPAPATEMSVIFIFKSTGTPGSDPSRSHGDDFPITGKVTINSDDDFDGSYLYGGHSLEVASNQALTKRTNPQSTKVTAPESGIGVTVEEVLGNTNLYDCPADRTCFGEWSVINVNNGVPYTTTGGFAVVIGYDQVPGNANDARFVHLIPGDEPGEFSPTFIENFCDATITVNCIVSVNSMNGDLFYTLQIDNNGPIRGI